MTLTIQHLSYHYHNRPLIENISHSFQSGILYGILGPNGAGKSTLLKTLARVWEPTKGKLFWHQQDLNKLSRLEMSRIVSFVSQNPPSYFDFTVFEMVHMGCYPQTLRSKHIPIVEEVLKQLNIWDLRHQQLSCLSGGERQRVYIARALATQAPIMLLDEPTSYLDLRHQLEIWQLLRSLTAQGKLCIVAVHDLRAAERYCDQLLVLRQGKCEAAGTYTSVMTPDFLHRHFGICLDEKTNSFELSF
jgi:iron complex transport system ATP-binding protein